MVQPVIAVVDDNQPFLELLGNVLAAQGYCSFTLADAREAVSALRNVKPAVILLTANLGGRLNGWELFSALRSDPDTRNIPVIVISGDAGNPLHDSALLPACGLDVLHKPFHWSVLRARIEELVQNMPAPGARA